MTARVELIGIPGLPEILPGDLLGSLIASAVRAAGDRVASGDVIVVSQKAVSKAEGRVRDLARIRPSGRARELARSLRKDPRLVELVLEESRVVIRAERGVLVVETKNGWICANAGIDTSNVPGAETVTLLPEDPDRSARRIRAELTAIAEVAPAVVVADSFGRPWRLGQTDVAIGCAGLAALDDRRGRTDREGRELSATVIAVADQLAAAADLIRTKEAGMPACLIRGLSRLVTVEDGPGAGPLRRPEPEDLFR
jgi:coenzyme F420-0:L-glutamate ligase / coenzyme F420-1:gamma-L-glutamate ligase